MAEAGRGGKVTRRRAPQQSTPYDRPEGRQRPAAQQSRRGSIFGTLYSAASVPFRAVTGLLAGGEFDDDSEEDLQEAAVSIDSGAVDNNMDDVEEQGPAETHSSAQAMILEDPSAVSGGVTAAAVVKASAPPPSPHGNTSGQHEHTRASQQPGPSKPHRSVHFQDEVRSPQAAAKQPQNLRHPAQNTGSAAAAAEGTGEFAAAQVQNAKTGLPGTETQEDVAARNAAFAAHWSAAATPAATAITPRAQPSPYSNLQQLLQGGPQALAGMGSGVSSPGPQKNLFGTAVLSSGSPVGAWRGAAAPAATWMAGHTPARQVMGPGFGITATGGAGAVGPRGVTRQGTPFFRGMAGSRFGRGQSRLGRIPASSQPLGGNAAFAAVPRPPPVGTPARGTAANSSADDHSDGYSQGAATPTAALAWSPMRASVAKAPLLGSSKDPTGGPARPLAQSRLGAKRQRANEDGEQKEAVEGGDRSITAAPGHVVKRTRFVAQDAHGDRGLQKKFLPVADASQPGSASRRVWRAGRTPFQSKRAGPHVLGLEGDGLAGGPAMSVTDTAKRILATLDSLGQRPPVNAVDPGPPAPPLGWLGTPPTGANKTQSAAALLEASPAAASVQRDAGGTSITFAPPMTSTALPAAASRQPSTAAAAAEQSAHGGKVHESGVREQTGQGVGESGRESGHTGGAAAQQRQEKAPFVGMLRQPSLAGDDDDVAMKTGGKDSERQAGKGTASFLPNGDAGFGNFGRVPEPDAQATAPACNLFGTSFSPQNATTVSKPEAVQKLPPVASTSMQNDVAPFKPFDFGTRASSDAKSVEQGNRLAAANGQYEGVPQHEQNGSLKVYTFGGARIQAHKPAQALPDGIAVQMYASKTYAFGAARTPSDAIPSNGLSVRPSESSLPTRHHSGALTAAEPSAALSGGGQAGTCDMLIQPSKGQDRRGVGSLSEGVKGEQAKRQRSSEHVDGGSPRLDAAAKKVLQEAAATPLPDGDSDDEQPAQEGSKGPGAPAQDTLPATLRPDKPLFPSPSSGPTSTGTGVAQGKTQGDSGLPSFPRASTAATLTSSPQQTNVKSTTSALAAGGWGADFLAANKQQQNNVTAAVQKEVEKAGGPTAGGGWGAAFLQQNKAQQSEAAAAIAKEVKSGKADGNAPSHTGLSFGLPAASAATDAKPLFGFGVPAAAASQSQMFSFAPAPAATPAVTPSAAQPFSFGAPASGASGPAAALPAFTFGGNTSAAPVAAASQSAATTPVFGFGAAATAASAPAANTADFRFADGAALAGQQASSFGQQPSQAGSQPVTSFTAGTGQATVQTSSTMFAAAPPATIATTMAIQPAFPFGSTASAAGAATSGPSQGPAAGGFGVSFPAQEAQMTTAAFGTQQANLSFGAAPAPLGGRETSAGAMSGSFGGSGAFSNPASAPAALLFGTSQAAQVPSFGAPAPTFGATQPGAFGMTAPSGAQPFGATPAPASFGQAPASAMAFGSSSAAANAVQQGAAPFGPQQPFPGAFGTSQFGSAPSAFGAMTTQNPFGAPPSATGTFQFGSAAQPAGAPDSVSAAVGQGFTMGAVQSGALGGAPSGGPPMFGAGANADAGGDTKARRVLKARRKGAR